VVVHQADVDLLFQALADATRRDIVRRTLDCTVSVTTLARDYPMSFAAVQKHVAILERAGLVTKQRQGRERLVAGNPAALRSAHDALGQLEQTWRDRVARMNDLLASDDL
jgi:DNA-binding transcriptional ArsR family regulator